jgi:hypothetical protein
MDLLRFVSDWLSFCYLFRLVSTVPYTPSVPAWTGEPIDLKVVYIVVAVENYGVYVFESHQYMVQPDQQRKIEKEMYIYALKSFPIVLIHEPSGLRVFLKFYNILRPEVALLYISYLFAPVA